MNAKPIAPHHKEAEEMAEKIAQFIRYNNIDLSKHTMREIVMAYRDAQLEAINKAADDLYFQMTSQL